MVVCILSSCSGDGHVKTGSPAADAAIEDDEAGGGHGDGAEEVEPEPQEHGVPPRVVPNCNSVAQLDHFIPDFLIGLVAVFLTR